MAKPNGWMQLGMIALAMRYIHGVNLVGLGTLNLVTLQIKRAVLVAAVARLCQHKPQRQHPPMR
jgi:hypothetical protein